MTSAARKGAVEANGVTAGGVAAVGVIYSTFLHCLDSKKTAAKLHFFVTLQEISHLFCCRNQILEENECIF